MHSKASRNIIAGIGLTILAALCSVIISIQQSKKINDSNIAIENTRLILTTSQKVLIHTIEIETAGRGYILTGKKEFVDSVYSAINDVESEIKLLNELTKKTPNQINRIKDINKLINIRINSTLQQIDAYNRKDTRLLNSLLMQGFGAAAMAKIQTIASQFNEEQNRLLKERRNANSNAYEQLKNIYYVTLIIIFSALIILGLRIIEDYNLRKKNIKDLETYNQKLEHEVSIKAAEIQSVFERVSDAFVALDVNWNYTYTNSKADEIFGKPKGYLKGKHIWTEFPDGINQPFYFAYYRAMKTQRFDYIEAYYPPYDKWFENHIYPSPTGLSIYFRDITEKKKAEQTVKAANERFELMSKATNDVVWDWDLRNNTIWRNENFYTNFGYLKHVVENDINAWRDNIHPDDRDRVITSFDNAIKNKQILWQAEYKFIKADGGIVQLFDRGFSLLNKDGEVYRIVGSMTDITEQKKAQVQILKEKELSDSVINSLPGIFYLYDQTGKFLRWNKNFETVSEYKAEEISKMHPLDFFRKSEKKVLEERIKLVFENGSAEVEANFFTKSGKLIPFYFNGWRLQYEGKTCLIGVGIDITERKRTSEALEATNLQLRELSGYLSTVREEERKHIAREIHDELGQQVTAVKIDISLLKKKVAGLLPQLEDEFLQVSNILDDTVKTIRRISSELRPSILDDIGLIPALQWQCSEFMRRTGTECVFENNINQNISFKSDTTTGVFRILQESLTNIARHANATKVQITTRMADGFFELQISDDGVGFDTSSDKKTFGLLGMRERAMMMNGNLTIASDLQKGTTTTLTIPPAT